MFPQKKCFIVVDMQNDTCHIDGIYNKNGLGIQNIQSIIPNIIETIHFCKNNQIPIIATQFTILEDFNKKAIGLDAFIEVRPFLKNEGFRENSWGHDFLEQLPQIDYKIKKWSISGFYQTELEKYLNAFDIKEIIIGGVTTNEAVEMLAREAMVRNYRIVTLIDCVANYSEELHKASLTNLSAFGKIINSKDWMHL
ncbi:MAG: hypothetical protein AMS24_01525 [Chlamydiae bacterium SM23_39]|nr:MAG: hypothetical protein AMS24_01525 [Chlamydiae bacterium SM23_39]